MHKCSLGQHAIYAPWSFFRALTCLVILAAFAATGFAQSSAPVQLLQPGGTAGDSFGTAAAVDGDTLIIGAPGDDIGSSTNQGGAHVYRWTGTGWAFEATLTAGAAGDGFGSSVAISGDTALVGAPRAQVGTSIQQGVTYVFVRTGTTWTQQARLTSPDGAVGDHFGAAVALDGDSAVVGAPSHSPTVPNQGEAYLFTRTGSAWSVRLGFTPAVSPGGDMFGQSVSISGDTVLVGSPLRRVGANSGQGSAYVFVRSGGTLVQQAEINAGAGGHAGDFLGWSVSLSGDTALVGSPQSLVSGHASQGSAYVFSRAGGAWTQQAQLTAPDGAASDQLGTSVALSGDTALIGAIGHGSFEGAAYIFIRSGAAWSILGGTSAPDGAANDSFGSAVAISGDNAVVGAMADAVGSNAVQGSAWVFSRVAGQWVGPNSKLTASDAENYDSFGFSTALSGDTAVVGAVFHDVGSSISEGSAYVFVRSGQGWSQQAELTSIGGSFDDEFGSSVGVDGDTAVVGARSAGTAYVFVRNGTAWAQQAQLTPTPFPPGGEFGWSIAISGDTAVVGTSGAGMAFVFVRTGTTWTQQAQLSPPAPPPGAQVGWSVAISGNTAIVGAPGAGAAYVFVRSGTSWTQQTQLGGGSGFGYSVSISNDTAMIGSPSEYVGSNPGQGAAYVFVRSGMSWSQQARLLSSDGASNDAFGQSVALSGDTAVAGAFQHGQFQGAAYVFFRTGTAWTQNSEVAASGYDHFGQSVAAYYNTAMFSATAHDSGQGAAWVYDFNQGDIPLAHNDVTNVSYPSLAGALLPAVSGQQITASDAAWRTIGSVNTLGRSLALLGSNDIRTPSTSTLELGGSSVLGAPSGSMVQLDGQLRISAGASADISTDSFTLGSRGLMTLRTGSSLSIDTPVASLEGQTSIEQGASLSFSGAATAIGPTSAGVNASLSSGGAFANVDTFSMTAGTVHAPLFWNRDTANIFGSSAVFGPYTNDTGATTTIRSGTLYVFGSLTNNGTINGTLCTNCLATPPNLDVDGNLVEGPGANLVMPFMGSLVHVGGNFDCAINSNSRYDLSLATLQLEGNGTLQTLEVMSTDVGPNQSGLDRTLPGHYPIGALEIGPSPSTVQIVDQYDNDNLGQNACEALYVQTLQIDAGSHLINPSCRIYYATLINHGSVDVPGNLVHISTCGSADFNCDGDIGTDADIEAFFRCLAGTCPGGPCPSTADFNGDGDIGTDADIEAFFRVLAGGSC